MKTIKNKLLSLSKKSKILLIIVILIIIAGSAYGIVQYINEMNYQKYIETAETHMKKGETGSAIKNLNKAIKLKDKKTIAYVDLIKTQISIDKGEDALKTISQAKKKLSKANFLEVQKYEKTAYYNAYKSYVSEYEKKYGSPLYEDGIELGTISGVYFLSLTDYNGDGINELTIFYTDDESTGGYNIKIYTYDSQNYMCKSIFDSRGKYSLEDDAIVISQGLDVNYLVLGSDEGLGQFTYNGKEFVCEKMVGPAEYGELDVYKNHFDNLNIYMRTNFSTTYSPNTELLQQIRDVKDELNKEGTFYISDDDEITDSTQDTQESESSQSTEVDYSPYLKIINNAKVEMKDGNPDNYNPYDRGDNHIFYDIDGDGVKELAIDYGSAWYEDTVVFYTIKNGEALRLGEVEMQHGYKYQDKDGNLVFAGTGSGGFRYIIGISDDKLDVNDVTDDYSAYMDETIIDLDQFESLYSLDEIVSMIQNN